MKNLLGFLLYLACIGYCSAQNNISINAEYDEESQTFSIQQTISFKNESTQSLDEIYLNDWANAYSSKSTPLAKRFAEEYKRKFHFAKREERGYTEIKSFLNTSGDSIKWDRPLGHPDILRLKPISPLLPGQTIDIHIDYTVKIPSDKFTRFGIDSESNLKLRNWYITPAVYKDGWQYYSDRDMGDLYTPPSNINITLKIPEAYYVASGLAVEEQASNDGFKTVTLQGDDRVDSKLYLTKTYIFETKTTNFSKIITNVEDDGLQPEIKNLILGRILHFLNDRLGEYPHEKIFVTREDYMESPIYGLNQLPSFLRPFPDGFQYDVKQLKTITSYYLENTLLNNPRKEQWVNDAILISLIMDYVDIYYPKMKLIGSLSDVIGIRWFHAADLKFNDQYQFLFMNMARLNLDQPLTTSQDSLVKFNKNIANAYKAGIGLKYLENFQEDDAVKTSISQYYSANKLQLTSASEFEEILKENSNKNIDWFFENYVATNKNIDFKIKHVEKLEDSLLVTINNKTQNNMPISLYGLKDGEVVYKTWVEDIPKSKEVMIPNNGIERLALNYENEVPEVNQRDNYKRVTSLFSKPLQFRIFQDIEDPKYNQIFFMPEFDYNLYDGVSIGPKVYNKTFLNKNFNFNLSPKFGFGSQTMVGSASFSYTSQFKNQKLYAISYGLGGTRFSYGYNLFYEKFTPYLSFRFRNQYLRDNERQALTIRNINVKRDVDPLAPVEQPDYNVFNVNYRYSNPHLSAYSAASFDYQLAEKFSKISMSLEYRKLFKSNRQLNLRFFAGTFLYNDTEDMDYFSFALDRPTDYLFDYNYYGRSQGSGLFSQQIIVAEGGFKSQLEPAFANQWLSTVNASTNLWKWIFAYGDVGLIKNKNENAKVMYDSGIRVSLVDDYFEVFFPVYSNLGWEVSQDNYDQKIRFIVSLDINTLVRLFTRRWY